jgi:hypothetical protein
MDRQASHQRLNREVRTPEFLGALLAKLEIGFIRGIIRTIAPIQPVSGVPLGVIQNPPHRGLSIEGTFFTSAES